MAQIGSARVLQLLRGARKPRQPRRVSGPAAPPLGAVTPLPESKEQTCMVIPCSPCQPMAASSTCTPSLSRRSLRRQSSEIRAVCAIAKPESTYPETTAFKSTRPSGSGDIEQNSTGHSYSGFALMSARTDPRGGYQATGIPTATAIERDTEANRKQREEFVARIATISPESLIFLDESGVTTSMTRLYARRTGGGRICETTPGGRWKIMTILGAMSLRGMIASHCCPATSRTDSIGCKYRLSRYCSPSLEVPVKWAFSR